MFILTSRFLLYCKEWPSSASQKRIPVAEVSEVGEEERKGHRVVAFRAGGATYYCYGDRNEDVDDWKYILNRTVRASASEFPWVKVIGFAHLTHCVHWSHRIS